MVTRRRRRQRAATITSPSLTASASCWRRSDSTCPRDRPRRTSAFPVHRIQQMNKPPRILIVDDNETNRDILVTRLQAHGYELAQAADGEQALAAAKSLLPDLILLDVMMPKLDGIEVCRRLKSDPAMPFTPIILVTAKSDSKDVVAGLNAGADEYLTKPIDQAARVARVKSVLRITEL